MELDPADFFECDLANKCRIWLHNGANEPSSI